MFKREIFFWGRDFFFFFFFWANEASMFEFFSKHRKRLEIFDFSIIG